MDLNVYFKSVIDQDTSPVVICDLNHTIIYMNPSAVARYAKRGGAALVGKSLLDCHSAESIDKINLVIDFFKNNEKHNIIYTYSNPKENCDVYMVALRDDNGSLIGYYEKHESRNPEKRGCYELGEN